MSVTVVIVPFGVIGILGAIYLYCRCIRKRNPARKEHTEIESKLRGIWRNMRKQTFSNEREAVLLLHCESGWNILDSIRVLAGENHGVGAMILCRSMFERAAIVDYTGKSTNADLIPDYIDYGKLVAYEVAQAKKISQSLLDNHKAEYGIIKDKFGKRNWHKGTISSLVEESEFYKVLQPGEHGLYQGFYKESSSIAHGDSYIFLHHSPSAGWTLRLEPDELHDWAINGLSVAYAFMTCMMASASEALGLPLGSDFDALHPLLESLPNT